MVITKKYGAISATDIAVAVIVWRGRGDGDCNGLLSNTNQLQ